MELLQPLTLSNLQPFIDNPEQLVTQHERFQIAVANYPETPRRLLEVLVNSSNAQIAEAAQLHVNWTGEITEGWQEAVDEILPHRELGQNDRLAVELLKIAPVPEYFLSEWVPAEQLIQGLRNPYMPLRYRLKLLARLAQEPTLEPRLQVAESNETPLAVLEELAGDLKLPLRLAVKCNPSCPSQLIELVEQQHTTATDWNTDAEQLAILGQSRWASVRLAVAQNPNAPAQTLMQLATDALLKIQLAVAQNPETPFSVLAVLAEHPEKEVQAAVVVHANVTGEILQRLFPTQQHLLRQQEDLPAGILERFFSEAASDIPTWKNSKLRYLLLKQANTPIWILFHLANVDLEALRAEKLATHQHPPSPETLQQWIENDTRFLANIAKHPQVSVEILEQLAQFPNPWAQLAVARNMKTPAPLRLQLLLELIHHPELSIQVEIASDPNTPVNILEQLASAFPIVNLVDTIRQMLPNASNYLVDAIRTFIATYQPPETILFELQQDAAREPMLQKWRQLLANLAKSDRATLEALCRQMLPAIGLEGVAPSLPRWLKRYQYPSPEFTLYGLLLWFILPGNSSNSGRRAVPVALIGNPSTPAALLEQLQIQLTQPPDKAVHYDDDCDMRLAVAFNPLTSETQRIEYLQQALSSGGDNIWHIRGYIAKNPNTPVSVLEQIAQRGAIDTKNVAENPNAPVNIIRQAAQQYDCSTLRLVAKNLNTPVDLLKELVLNRGKEGVREAALKNPSLDRLTAYEIQLEWQAQEETAKAHELLAHRADSPYALAQVLTKGDRHARITAARSHKTPIHVLQQLAKDPDEAVRQAVSQNSNLPLNSLLYLAQDPSAKVRLSLAYASHQKTSTPVQLLERLSQDESEQVRTRVAEHPDTPVEILVRLGNDSSREVKVKLTGNPNTPVTVLTRLGLEENLVNQRNPNTPGIVLAQAVSRMRGKKLADFIKHPVKGSQMPAETLARLATHSDNSVRYRVAQNSSTPTSALEQLARDPYVPTLRAVVENSNTPPHVLEELANNPDLTTRLSIARNPNTPAQTLAQIVLSSQTSGNVPWQTVDMLKSAFPGNSNDVLRAIASNPRTPLDALTILARREFVSATPDPESIIPGVTDDDVVRSLASNPSLTPDLLGILTQDPCVDVRVYLVRHPNLTEALWMQLAEDKALSVREGVAATAAPECVLKLLARDEQSEVRVNVATNLNTPIAVLEFLAGDENAAVRTTVASNPNLPTAQLERLAQDEKVEVRRAVAQNSNTPDSIRQALRALVLQPATRQTIPTLRGLSRLYNPSSDDLATVLSEYAQSDNAFVRFVTLLHPLTPREMLQQGARSQSWLERYAVADNPATPVESAAQLVQDSNRIVRATARAYL